MEVKAMIHLLGYKEATNKNILSGVVRGFCFFCKGFCQPA